MVFQKDKLASVNSRFVFGEVDAKKDTTRHISLHDRFGIHRRLRFRGQPTATDPARGHRVSKRPVGRSEPYHRRLM